MTPLAIVVLSCLVLASQAMTTNHPHPTHDTNEHEGFQFFYNYHTQNMLVKVRSSKMAVTCYALLLSEDEKKLVHSDAGIRQVEVRALGMLSSAYSVTSDSLDEYDVEWCNHGIHNATVSYFTV